MEGETRIPLRARFSQTLSPPLIVMPTTSKSKFVNFKAVKDAVNITQILDRYGILGGLKKEPSGYAGSCPFCESESPRPFRASEEKNCFNCLSCQTGGNILDFVSEYEECSIREAALKIQDWFNLDTRPTSNRRARKKATRSRSPKAVKKSSSGDTPVKKLGFEYDLDQEHEWLEAQGIDPETVIEFGLGYCSEGILQGCIAFPVHDEDFTLTGYLGYDLSMKPDEGDNPWRIPKQLEITRLVFNVPRTDPTGEGELVIARDPLDLVIRWQEGEKRIVALLGDSISATQVKLLESLV